MPGPAEPSLAERRALLRQALAIVSGSRRLIRGKIARGFSTKTKADESLVTDADLAAERFLRRELSRRFPDHGIIGEEFAPANAGSDFLWTIDPIDGTLSFARGIPLYGTILALHHRGRPVLGVIDHPSLGECYSAARGLGAALNGRRIRLQDLGPGEKVEREVVATGDRMHFLKCGRARDFDRLMRRHPQVRSYADCFGHTLAARGAVGAMVDFGIRLWDMAASQVLIEEAGGRYACLLSPPPGDLGQGFYGIVCGKPAVVDWLLPLFGRTKR